MQIIEPNVELWLPENPIQHVARCARVSYMAESKGEESDRKLYDRCKHNNHNSIFRHESHYYIIPVDANMELIHKLEAYMCSPYINGRYNADTGCYYIATNGNWIKDHQVTSQKMLQFEVDDDTFDNTELGHQLMRYTFFVTTQISTSRELNRVMDDFGITESSTRYIKIGGKIEPTIVKPWWYDEKSIKTTDYLTACNNSFDMYDILIEEGLKPQDARGVLPLDTVTFVAYTAPVSVWKYIIDLRYFGTTGKPHPNAQIIAGKIKDILEDLGYNF